MQTEFKGIDTLPSKILASLANFIKLGKVPKAIIVSELVYPEFEKRIWEWLPESNGYPVDSLSFSDGQASYTLIVIKSQIVPDDAILLV